MVESVSVAGPQVVDRRADINAVLKSLDDLCADLLRLRLSYACVGLLLEFEDAGVDPLAPEVVSLRSRLLGLYDGLNFSLIEEWL